MEGLSEWLAKRNRTRETFWDDARTEESYRHIAQVDGEFVFVGVKPVAGKFNLKGVAEVLEARGLNPTEMVLDLLPTLKKVEQADVLLRLMEYCYPKLSRAEVEAKVNDVFEHDPTERAARALAVLTAGGVDATRLAAVLGGMGSASGSADGGVQQSR